MDFLYGKLNNLIETLKYTFSSLDGTLKIQPTSNNNVDFAINKEKLVTIRRILKDPTLSNDAILSYGLFAYNENTKSFDIRLGDEIKVGLAEGSLPINKVLINVGTKLIENENGDLLFDDNGNPIIEPVYLAIKSEVSATGLLVLEQIPVSALTDYTIVFNAAGEEIGRTYIKSVLDGNAGGIVY